MLALPQKDSPLAHEFDRLKEAIRRYRLPFGIAGKHTSFKKAKEIDFPKTTRNVVLQDFRVLTPPEYIFGLQPGDCVSVTVDVMQYRPEYNAQLELLTATFQPAFVIVAAGSHTHFAPRTLRQFASSVSSNAGTERTLRKQAFWGVLICIVDERSRNVVFI